MFALPTAVRLALLFSLTAAAPLLAQGTKPAKPAKPKKGEPVAAAPKDDPVTAKDKVIVAIDKFLASRSIDTKRDEWRGSLSAPPPQTYDPARQYQWHLQTTKGELVVRLRTDVAPMHVTSAIYLTRAGYYDGLVFHRVIQGFMAQGGCPRGDGTGGPGYFLDGECDPKAKHDKPGILSTANTGQPKSDGSQFFLTFGPTPHLDGKHTVFGEVVDGAAVLQAIEAVGSGDDSGTPSEKVAIQRAWVTVTVDPAATPAPDGKPAKGGKGSGAAKGGKDGGKDGDRE